MLLCLTFYYVIEQTLFAVYQPRLLSSSLGVLSFKPYKTLRYTVGWISWRFRSDLVQWLNQLLLLQYFMICSQLHSNDCFMWTGLQSSCSHVSLLTCVCVMAPTGLPLRGGVSGPANTRPAVHPGPPQTETLGAVAAHRRLVSTRLSADPTRGLTASCLNIISYSEWDTCHYRAGRGEYELLLRLKPRTSDGS